MKKIIVTILILLIIGYAGYYAYQVFYLKTEDSETVVSDDNLPDEDEPYENETNLTSNFVDPEEEKEVDLKYDQYITASGYAGASDHVYYTRNGSLYHLVLSSEYTVKLAEGVDKIEEDLDCLRAYKGDNFQLISEDEYVIYVD